MNFRHLQYIMSILSLFSLWRSRSKWTSALLDRAQSSRLKLILNMCCLAWPGYVEAEENIFIKYFCLVSKIVLVVLHGQNYKRWTFPVPFFWRLPLFVFFDTFWYFIVLISTYLNLTDGSPYLKNTTELDFIVLKTCFCLGHEKRKNKQKTGLFTT